MFSYSKKFAHFFSYQLRFITNIPAKMLIFLLSGIRPLLGPASCRFELTCTRYAIKQLQEENILKALWAITKRVLSCNPFF